MRHVDLCIETSQLEEVKNGIKLQNLKRKIQENPEYVLKRVKKHYKRAFPSSSSHSHFEWRGCNVYDTQTQQLKMVWYNEPIMIPPVGRDTHVVKFPYVKRQWTPRALPTLTRDTLASIFKFVPGWELIGMRTVCRQWNSVIVNNMDWSLHIVYTPQNWAKLSPFKTYINHMFLNFESERQIVEFFLANVPFFVHICGLIVGHKSVEVTYRTKFIDVNGYKLSKKTKRMYYGEKIVSVNTFLDAYRQSIL
jgi:hypothetical protein